MLNGGDGIENGKETTTTGLISKTKQQQLCTCSTLAVVVAVVVARLQRETF